VRDRNELSRIFTRLCQQVAADLARKGYVGKTIGIKLRYDNFQSVTRDQTLTTYTADAAAIRDAAGQCLKRVGLERRLRLLGVRVGSLMKLEDWQTQGLQAEEAATPYTVPLFDDLPD
jgi:DNA polymerase-4